jgi:hypothetical protein
MSNAIKIDNIKKHEEAYNNILGFYNLAEQLIDSVQHPDIHDKVSYLDFIEPIVEQLEVSTDILSEEYRNFVATGKKPGFLTKIKIEKALNNIVSTLTNCKKNLEDKVKAISSLLYSELQQLITASEKKLMEEVVPAFLQLDIHSKLNSVAIASGTR